MSFSAARVGKICAARASSIVAIGSPAELQALEPRRLFAAAVYTLKDVGAIPAYANTVATDINDAGTVVGYGQTPISQDGDYDRRAFVTVGGVAKAIIPGAFSTANAINNHGEVVGDFNVDFALPHAFAWQNGKLRDLNSTIVPSNFDPSEFGSSAVDVNDRGDVLSNRLTFMDDESSFNDAAGHRLPLPGTINGEDVFDVGGINNRRDFVGEIGYYVGPEQAIYFHNSHSSRLGTFVGPTDRTSPQTESSAAAVNDAGFVVGSSSTHRAENGGGNPDHAFLYAHHRLHDLGSLNNGDDSFANDINNQGIIVGTDHEPTYTRPGHAFVVRHGKMADLNALVALPRGVVLTDAVAINNNGQIAVNGLVNGRAHAFLLTPAKPTATITGHVFYDRNNDGRWASSEKPLSGWEVYIDSNDNGKWDSGEQVTITDAVGRYRLKGLEAGTHHVRVGRPTGWIPTGAGNGLSNVTAAAGQSIVGKDFGVRNA